MITNAFTGILASILLLLIGGLITYFFSTRNLETKMNDISDRKINEYDTRSKPEIDLNNIKKMKFAIDDHKEECGDKLEKSLEDVKSEIVKVKLSQEKISTVMENISVQVTNISKKI